MAANDLRRHDHIVRRARTCMICILFLATRTWLCKLTLIIHLMLRFSTKANFNHHGDTRAAGASREEHCRLPIVHYIALWLFGLGITGFPLLIHHLVAFRPSPLHTPSTIYNRFLLQPWLHTRFMLDSRHNHGNVSATNSQCFR